MIELWLPEHPSIEQMEEVLERIIEKGDPDTVRNHNAVELHTHLERMLHCETPAPDDRKRLNALMAGVLTRVFNITLPAESEYLQ